MAISTRDLPPRVELVQRELDRFDRPRYLEIGVHAGTVFLNVTARRKVGVDPAPRIRLRQRLIRPRDVLRSRVVETTSDEFFRTLDPRSEFDVVFVDGLHTAEQAIRDVLNSIERLSADGAVLVHDCFPPTAAAANPGPPARSEGGDAPWCGEVWRAMALLRATRPDLLVRVLDVDFGMGIIRRGSRGPVDLRVDEVAALSYEDLKREPARIIGLVSASDPGASVSRAAGEPSCG